MGLDSTCLLSPQTPLLRSTYSDILLHDSKWVCLWQDSQMVCTYPFSFWGSYAGTGVPRIFEAGSFTPVFHMNVISYVCYDVRKITK